MARGVFGEDMSGTEAQREGGAGSLEKEDQESGMGNSYKSQYGDVQGSLHTRPGAQRRVPRQTRSKFK